MNVLKTIARPKSPETKQIERVQVELAPRMLENFSRPARHRVFKGGRGSGKTRGLAKMSAIYTMKLAEAGREGIWLCSREHLNSLEESSLEEVKAAIRSEAFLRDYFDIGEKYVRTKNKRISYAFAGLRHNLDSIKSKANILGNWTDEAENVSEPAWRKLIPTIRDDGSENWVSYNPESPESATHLRFVENEPSNCIITDMNWRDNPWFTDALEQERQDDERLRPDTYDHVWEGGFLTITEAQIFRGTYEIDEFEPTRNWDGPFFGCDFGFSQDPTAFTEWYIYDNKLYCRREAVRKRLDLDKTAQFARDRMPGIEKHVVRADNARPESISYLRSDGDNPKHKRLNLPHIIAAPKWNKSVEEGIEYMKSFEKIIVHPDCPETAREFRLYSYKINRLTGDITPKIEDANNHCIDSGRYALAPMIQSRGRPRIRQL